MDVVLTLFVSFLALVGTFAQAVRATNGVLPASWRTDWTKAGWFDAIDCVSWGALCIASVIAFAASLATFLNP